MYSTLDKNRLLKKLLTLIFITLALLTIQISGDLAPNEDEDDNNLKVELDKQNVNPNVESTTLAPKVKLGFIHAFIASFSVIIVSEIGDKTFFIAAIMSMVIKMQLH
jgi:hypothetical protein